MGTYVAGTYADVRSVDVFLSTRIILRERVFYVSNELAWVSHPDFSHAAIQRCCDVYFSACQVYIIFFSFCYWYEYVGRP